MKRSPLVTIGMPVRNGGALIRAAIEAILAQELQDYQLVISDNASTDDTEEICLEYQRRDRRVRFERLDVNVGAAANFNRLAEGCRSPYFAWAAHDDEMHPGFLRRCVDALESHSDSAAAITGVQLIDQHGLELATIRPPETMCSANIAVRLHAHLDRIEWYWVYGLYRTNALLEALPLGGFFGSDVALTWALLLRHPYTAIPEVLMTYRQFVRTEVDLLSALLPAQEVGTRPRWDVLNLRRELSLSISRSAVSERQSVLARRELRRWTASPQFRHFLWSDLAHHATAARRDNHRTRAVAFLAAMAMLNPARTKRNVMRRLHRPDREHRVAGPG
jgi:glycosyltransferase involved in cell wall biosynthesis